MFGMKRRNPTADWVERHATVARVDLDAFTLCGTAVGDRADALSVLGPGVPGFGKEYEFSNWGIVLEIDGGTLKAFHVHFPAFRGTVTLRGRPLVPAEHFGLDAWIARCGDHDVVENDILTYLTDGREWEVILEGGRLKTLSVY